MICQVRNVFFTIVVFSVLKIKITFSTLLTLKAIFADLFTGLLVVMKSVNHIGKLEDKLNTPYYIENLSYLKVYTNFELGEI